MAWSNGGSAESFAMMTYQFLACPLQKLELLILMCKFLPKGIKIPYRVCRGKDNGPLASRKRDFHKPSLVALNCLKAAHSSV